MNAADRARLDAVPIPTGPDGNLARACVVYDVAGGVAAWSVAFLLDRHKELVGPAYLRPRPAIDDARYLNARAGA